MFGVGFRLRSGTLDVLHRVKYGGFPREGRALGQWLATGWGRELRPDLLRRVRHRTSLTASTRAARLDALTDMYEAGFKNSRKGVSVTPEEGKARMEVVLVDDVLTTGAMFRVCRSVLEAAGHRVIGGVWLAMA